MDRTLEDTFYILFTSEDADGFPIALLGSPVVSVYEDSSLAQITAGVSLSVDHDGITGLNLATVVATAGNGFETGKDYAAVITTGTVGGTSLAGKVVERFSLGLSAAAVGINNLQEQIGQISTGTAAISMAATNAVITTGTQVNTFASTKLRDGIYHQISDVGGAIDFYYEFDIGANGIGAEASLVGRLNSSNDDLDVYIYDWVAADWDLAGIVQGVNTDVDTPAVINLDITHTGIGANAGLVRVRATKASGLTSATFHMDQIYISYAVLGIDATDIVSNGAIDTSGGAVVNVVTVATNTDMRGTDSAATSADVAALNDLSTADILTAQLAESYAADGVAPTLSQALMLIQQSLGDFSISGTTVTVKELDGATTAATYTLDSDTAPTSKTRAT